MASKEGSRYLTLAAEIEETLTVMDGFVREGEEALILFGTRHPSPLEIRGAADLLHDFYTAVEDIFERIAEEINGGIPRGEHSHRDLLKQMSLDVPGLRPPILSTLLRDQLGEVLRFRHLFRHAYSHQIEWERVNSLLERVPEIHTELSDALRRFTDFLRQLGEET